VEEFVAAAAVLNVSAREQGIRSHGREHEGVVSCMSGHERIAELTLGWTARHVMAGHGQLALA
jgi:hypothetical protein